MGAKIKMEIKIEGRKEPIEIAVDSKIDGVEFVYHLVEKKNYEGRYQFSVTVDTNVDKNDKYAYQVMQKALTQAIIKALED